jgi:hypothetical protein
MTRYFVRAPLACAALVASTAAMASEEPIPGVDIVVRSHAGSSLIAQSHTDAHGRLALRALAPGDYAVDVDGRSLAAAAGRLRRSGPRAGERADRGSETVIVSATGAGVNVSSTLAYRAAAAGQAIHLRFTLRARAEIVVSIFDRWGND